MSQSLCSATQMGLIGCPSCGLVSRMPHRDRPMHCQRCGETLHARKPDSLRRSWALLIAATILYIPANVLPIMVTSNLIELHHDTILSGVVRLWTAGSWDLAVIVFVASIVVPLLKIGALALLLVTVRYRNDWHRLERARLYRLIERIGHWSMLDVFVVALLVALVHFRSLAMVEAGPGAVAFGAVVILTMLASMSFDPRMIWDPAPRNNDKTPS